MYWLIYSQSEKLWWSNEFGWVEKECAALFTKEEMSTLNLPIGGEWRGKTNMEIKEHHIRYYHVSPMDKTLKDCRNHGADHKAYKHTPQIDPRWSEKQIEAYWEGYKEV